MTILVLIGLILGMIACLIVATMIELNPRETTLVSVLLAIFSIVASWLATHLYSEAGADEMRRVLKKEHAENLRTYALKAAEKAQNLSSEVDRLNNYLTETQQPEVRLMSSS